MSERKYFDLGLEKARLGLSPEEVRTEIRPLIESDTQAITNAKERKERYVALWQEFWQGYNQNPK